jgi:FKBP-type peptidyl-prolyl cis-trans isomerase
MHRHSFAFVSLLALAATVACSKEKPQAPAPAATSTEELSEPAGAAKSVTPAPTPAPEAANEEAATTSEVAAAPTAPVEAEPAAAESEEEPAVEKGDEKVADGGEEAPAEAKKTTKKKSGKTAASEKEAEAPAKEEKPKFTELGVEVTKAGAGMAATSGTRVTIHYKASVADAEKPFDSTFASNRPLEVDLAANAKLRVIEGLRRGLEGLTPGTEARLQIPASLAWGEKGDAAVGVPANADVVIEVHVLDVQ